MVEWIQSLGTLALVAITGVYVWLTYKLNRESRDSRELASLPVLACQVIDKRPNDSKISHLATLSLLSVRNVGNAPALSTTIATVLENRDSSGITVDDQSKSVGTVGINEAYDLEFEGSFGPDPEHEGSYELPKLAVTISYENAFGRAFHSVTEFQLESGGFWKQLVEIRSLK